MIIVFSLIGLVLGQKRRIFKTFLFSSRLAVFAVLFRVLYVKTRGFANTYKFCYTVWSHQAGFELATLPVATVIHTSSLRILTYDIDVFDSSRNKKKPSSRPKGCQ